MNVINDRTLLLAAIRRLGENDDEIIELRRALAHAFRDGLLIGLFVGTIAVLAVWFIATVTGGGA